MTGDRKRQRPPPEDKGTGSGPDRDEPYRYYASGKRVDVALDDEWIAVSQDRAKQAQVPAAERNRLREAARPLRGDLVLVPTRGLSPASREALESAGAVQKVFKAEGATLVALPEVRVEDSSQARREALRRWLDDHPGVARVLKEQDEMLVLQPVSGDGSDALRLAATLSEEVRVTSAQPRFMRVVRRPSTMRG